MSTHHPWLGIPTASAVLSQTHLMAQEAVDRLVDYAEPSEPIAISRPCLRHMDIVAHIQDPHHGRQDAT